MILVQDEPHHAICDRREREAALEVVILLLLIKETRGVDVSVGEPDPQEAAADGGLDGGHVVVVEEHGELMAPRVETLVVLQISRGSPPDAIPLMRLPSM